MAKTGVKYESVSIGFVGEAIDRAIAELDDGEPKTADGSTPRARCRGVCDQGAQGDQEDDQAAMPRLGDQITRVRRSRSLVADWQGGEFRLQNYLTQKSTPAAPLVLEILTYCAQWRTLSEVLAAFSAVSRRSLRRLLRLLMVHSFLDRTRGAGSDREPLEGWSTWTPEAAFFHFATKDAQYRDLDELHAELVKKAAVDRAPAPDQTLHWSAADAGRTDGAGSIPVGVARRATHLAQVRKASVGGPRTRTYAAEPHVGRPRMGANGAGSQSAQNFALGGRATPYRGVLDGAHGLRSGAGLLLLRSRRTRSWS